ncbi:hypothetical protein HK104_005647, partial [Borealophlyctis nickersoniae]
MSRQGRWWVAEPGKIATLFLNFDQSQKNLLRRTGVLLNLLKNLFWSDLGTSTSKFGRVEEEYLRIRIRDTDDITTILPVNFENDEISPKLSGLLFPNIEFTFLAEPLPGATVAQQKFIRKLAAVLRDNAAKVPPRDERNINEFVRFLLDEAGFDDAVEMNPCLLRLQVGDTEFATKAHRQIDVNFARAPVVIVDEVKHVNDPRSYKKGAIQHAACMIAAAQQTWGDIDYEGVVKMRGLHWVGPYMRIVLCPVPCEYIDQLLSSRPPKKDVEYI